MDINVVSGKLFCTYSICLRALLSKFVSHPNYMSVEPWQLQGSCKLMLSLCLGKMTAAIEKYKTINISAVAAIRREIYTVYGNKKLQWVMNNKTCFTMFDGVQMKEMYKNICL